MLKTGNNNTTTDYRYFLFRNDANTDYAVFTFEGTVYDSQEGYEIKEFSALSHTGEVGTGGGINPVPEPATMLLFVTGLIGLAGFSRRRNK